ncbi:hypothetical protein M409DRAFT_66547 [Zasmidium cellare ATCC 36951]|uniref:F-box domain-containing protein n=1 Tax=Zasmidium cellare ATCC 36951 TaxID=1080233 RepID=A0A6A6CM41_ZASCE|nr:uncharacterized protein M409DRAFT_66547 [Zasmidium cellare ATCC 36951]KAF2166506.1 hypothetical protein M409DRAFT_66547 [Zasmidium cellare ATCC 36951]
MSAESLQREGRAAYDKGEFSKALEYYNRAVGRGNPSTKLLDSVAATHYRLGALEAALAAAKKTIQTYREDATGYLRAGQVLLKMEKESTALEIYAYGLKSIKHVGVGFEKLKKAHDDLQQQLAPQKSIDPLSVLPRELAIFILEYLNFRQRIAISRVSKGWKSFIKSEPTLWAHLDFSGARKKVRTSFISTAINAGRSKITTATLNQLWDFDKTLAALIKHCPLESLGLANTGFQGQNLVDALKKATKLREFASQTGTDIGDKTLQLILECRGSTLEVLKFSSKQTKLFFPQRLDALKLPVLTTFDFDVPEVIPYWEVLTQLVTHSPKLQSLRFLHLDIPGVPFHHATALLDNDVSNDKKQLSKLKAFYIHNAVVEGISDPFELRGRLSQLQELGITHCLSLKDEHVDILLEHGKKLQILDLRCTSITGVAVKAIVQSGGVKKLVAYDCDKIGRDAIDWARKQGLQVDFKMTSNETGGKKVRY